MNLLPDSSTAVENCVSVAYSKSQIEKLGERLRVSQKESDLRMLEEHRLSFGEISHSTAKRVMELLNVPAVERPAKQTLSIIEKLNREKTNLARMQDLAGCRIVVPSLSDQDFAIRVLSAEFSDTKVDDKRDNPRHGYRSVHLISKIDGKLIELQIRTPSQNAWANIAERTSRVVDPAIKYGGGPADIQRKLKVFSDSLHTLDLVYQVATAALLAKDTPPTALTSALLALFPQDQVGGGEPTKRKNYIDELQDLALSRAIADGDELVAEVIRIKGS
ncbi:MAG TPA: RelA/SpoT domain-containing protein [Candidatus Eremiobacteraceae bacterium]